LNQRSLWISFVKIESSLFAYYFASNKRPHPLCDFIFWQNKGRNRRIRIPKFNDDCVGRTMVGFDVSLEAFNKVGYLFKGFFHRSQSPDWKRKGRAEESKKNFTFWTVFFP
jgi:hypothetical protein